jgi:hypothetical protein
MVVRFHGLACVSLRELYLLALIARMTGKPEVIYKEMSRVHSSQI